MTSWAEETEKSCFKSSRDIQGCKYTLRLWWESDEWKRSLINLKVHLNIKTSPDKAGERCCLTGGPGSPFHAPRSLMQLAPAECRYLGVFVMVEVYHSARLYCAASHELMMNARRDRERADCSREAATEGWTREQRCESQMRRRFSDGSRLEGRSANLKITDVVCLSGGGLWLGVAYLKMWWLESVQPISL